MSATEEVIKGLEYCRQHGRLGGKDCSAIFTYTNYGRDIVKINEYRHDCSYGKCKTGCVVTLVDDAIDLLKEQEAEQPIVHENSYGWKFYYCPKCKLEFYQNRKQAYCDKCGQKVKWDEL